MALRALLFTSDGTSSAVLCQVLTSLSVEAEICSELLVAMERLSKQSYDAILVDWDQEQDATVVLKVAREQKSASQALNVALVENDKDLARALQSGANSVIKKPIDPRLAHDTLSTARDLILSRQAERREKEARLAAAQAAVSAASEEYRKEPSPPKRGFLAQTAPRSALEAEQRTERATAPATSPYSSWQAARPPSALEEDEKAAREASVLEQKTRRDAPKPIPPVSALSAGSRDAAAAQDSTGIFSSYVEQEEEEKQASESGHSAQPKYVVFSLVACVIIASVLYVWAPGDSYSGRLTSLIHAIGATKSAGPAPAAPLPTPPATQDKPSGSPSVAQDSTPEPEQAETVEIDPSKIQIIESKAIPKPGAQQPAAAETQNSGPEEHSQPEVATTEQGAMPAGLVLDTPPPSQTQPVAPVAQPAVRPQHSRSERAPQRVSAPENTAQASEGRVGVVIPDSLKSSPSPAPANSLEPPTVPEEASRSLVIHHVDPEYPAQALRQRLEGPVVLQVWVARDGTIRDLKLLKGYFALGHAAFDAVKQWQFKPFTVNGRATEFQTTVTLEFKYPGAN